MSEVSDAVIVVVSEETGVITVCINGHLTRNYNAESLAQKLRVEILKEKPEEQSGKRSGFWKVKR
jgi:diadenylate cyclase